MSFLLAANEPAGGAALGEVFLATGMAGAATVVLGLLVWSHVTGRSAVLSRLGAGASKASGMPGWAALPTAMAGLSLFVAALGMYWDISLHIDQGRDAGPLANPAHYLILAGLFGNFSAGFIAIALAKGQDVGASAVRLAPGWGAPIGGVLMIAAAAFALIGFPLDDVWHRIFGQDVTLWGPTHLMLIGGAGLTLIGQAVLIKEGVRRARDGQAADGHRPGDDDGVNPLLRLVHHLRGVTLMGGLLVGLSTFQGEFDFGVPQFTLFFHPVLVTLAAAVGLVAARIWIGPGGAIGAAVSFLAIRGLVSGFVWVTGETVPALPLYLGSAVFVELAALAVGRGALKLGLAGGALVGTAGLATEWGWTNLLFPLPWTDAGWPEAAVAGLAAGLAGGAIGGLMGAALRGDLPRAGLARPTLLSGLAVVGVLLGVGLATTAPEGVKASVQLSDVSPGSRGEVRTANATVTLDPPTAADDARWLTVTSWQGGGLVVDRLERVREGVYRSTRPIPVSGDWKTLLRLHSGRELGAAPIWLPEDAAIPAKEVPAPAQFTRPIGDEKPILQREVKQDVPSWLWTVASLVVLSIALGFVAVLSWGMARVGRDRADAGSGTPGGTGTATAAPRRTPVPA